MLSIKNGKYYNLGEIGGFIQDVIKEPISLDNLIERIQLEYEVGKEDCANDVISFLDVLMQEELVDIKRVNTNSQ